jgi:hypothetical protein
MDDMKAVLDRGLVGFAPGSEAYERTLRRKARRQRRRRVSAATLALAVAAGGLSGAWIAFRPAPAPPAAALRPAITATFRVPAGVTDVAYGFGSLWAPGRRVVTRVDPATGRTVATIDVPGESDYRYLAVDEAPLEAAVWVTDSGTLVVYRIDPATNRVVAQVHLPGEGLGSAPVGVVAIPGSVLVSTYGGGLLRVDPASNAVRTLTRTGSRTGSGSLGFLLGQGGVAVGDGQVWAIDPQANRLVRIDPAAIPYDARFGSPVIAFGSAWVPDHPFLLRIELRSGRRQAAISFLAPVVLAADVHGVWVVSTPGGNPSVLQLIDPRTNASVGRRIPLKGTIVGSAVGGGAVWIGDFSGPAILRVQVVASAR